jgi:hypothetical protein
MENNQMILFVSIIGLSCLGVILCASLSIGGYVYATSSSTINQENDSGEKSFEELDMKEGLSSLGDTNYLLLPDVKLPGGVVGNPAFKEGAQGLVLANHCKEVCSSMPDCTHFHLCSNTKHCDIQNLPKQASGHGCQFLNAQATTSSTTPNIQSAGVMTFAKKPINKTYTPLYHVAVTGNSVDVPSMQTPSEKVNDCFNKCDTIPDCAAVVAKQVPGSSDVDCSFEKYLNPVGKHAASKFQTTSYLKNSIYKI